MLEEVTVNSKDENSYDFCPNYVHDMNSASVHEADTDSLFKIGPRKKKWRTVKTKCLDQLQAQKCGRFL